MTNSKDLISERLKQMNESKETLKQDKPNVVDSIATGKESKPDFAKMAEVLEAQKEDRKSENDGYIKDTIYIREDLYKAMQALCNKQGEKKTRVNAAYEMYLTKVYKELHKDLNLDNK